MSKSLGNFFTVREILARYQPEVVRFFILRAHYRSQLNYSDLHLEDAKRALDRLYTALKSFDVSQVPTEIGWHEPHAARFKEAMDDDFNTSEAIAVLFDLANEANKLASSKSIASMKALGGVLGLLQQDPQRYFQEPGAAADSGFTPEHIEQMIQQRLLARANKDYGEADRLRKELMSASIILEDTAKGTTWRRI
jgi:cysteinyl-tRNA synthetase